MKATSLKMLYQLLIPAPHLQEYILKKSLVFVLKNKSINPQETREFTVAYYIDPKIVEDPATKGISEITLSYTLFKVDKMYKGKKS